MGSHNSSKLFPILFNQCTFKWGRRGGAVAVGVAIAWNARCGYAAKIISAKLKNPSASRNCEFIAASFRRQVNTQEPGLKLLEIASGVGQHAGYLAPLCPNITFQPTEYDRSDFASIAAYADDCEKKNILPPLYVDVSKDIGEWKEAKFESASFDYMLNINMMHISPWACSEGLFRAAGILLKPHGLLMTYGPYAIDGQLTPQSNVQFDLSLKSRDPRWGVRDIRDLKKLAQQNGLQLKQMDDMPANNKFLTWIKLE